MYEGHATNEEGEVQPIYVHEIIHQDGELDWQISPSVDPLL